MPGLNKLIEGIRTLTLNESVVGLIVFLTWLVIMPIIIVMEFQEFALWALVLFALVLLGMLGALLYGRKSTALVGLTRDERTERFSMRATRNGFLMAVILTAMLAAGVWLRGPHIEIWDLIWIWGWATSAYMLSYLYYVMKG